MRIIKVPGKNNKHRVFMYALSTCPWCKKAKRFLASNDVEYEYVDVDLSSKEDLEKIRGEILSRRERLAYPTIIIDDKILIKGYREDEIREALEI